jgi:CubicO group peptidase (beta-lactamase class C family)
MLDQQITTAVRATITAWMSKEYVPGLALALLDEGRVQETAVFGLADSSGAIPLSPQTLFEAASLTKPAFAHVVLQLVEEGLLDLDRPLVDYLPAEERHNGRLLDNPGRDQLYDFVADDPRLIDVTARRVLSHSAGFANWTGAGKPLRLHYAPGTRFSYAGDGFQYLQDVIDRLLPGTPAQMMHERLLQPLGMSDSALQDNELSGRDLALPHDHDGQAQERTTWPLFLAAASLHTTAVDYGRFLAAVLTPGSSPAHLSPSMTAAMLRPQIQVNLDPPWCEGWPNPMPVLAPGVFWGLGWGLEEAGGRRAFWHWGDNGGYKAFAFGHPDSGAGFVMLSNGRHGGNLYRPLIERFFPGPHPALDWLEIISGS